MAAASTTTTRARDDDAGRRGTTRDDAMRLDAILESVRRDIVGHGATFGGAYGTKSLVYADYTASGRASRAVERCVARDVLPMYANTHTSTSTTGSQTSCFRAEARQVVAQCVNARVGYSDRHADVVTFTGSGSTSAIDRLARALGMHVPLPVNAPREARPVVFVGPHEHHSNILPWRESCAIVVEIPEEESSGMVDVDALRAALRAYASHATLIGSFSAASNVTGVRADVNLITETLHRGNALALWDYAAAAAYVDVDMNPVVFDENTGALNPYVYKDAIFMSPHKLPGGPGAPGILVAKRALFVNEVPSEPGGGTVFYVTSTDHRYLSNRVEREEGGTQDIVGSIRAGLAFQMKANVGTSLIEAAEERLRRRLFDELEKDENICLLGPRANSTTKRLPIASFLIRAPAVDSKSRFLHYSFTCAVLNDVFGVQARGGCACAGPYAHRLLGISPADAAAIEAHLLDKAEVLRPGFARVSLPYFASDAEIEYTLAAVRAVAAHGWRLLPMYRMDAKTGEWRHALRARSFPERKWLAHMQFPVDSEEIHESPPSEEEISRRLDEQLSVGMRILETCGQYRDGEQQGKAKNGQLRMPNSGGMAADERMVLAGGRGDDDSRLAYDEGEEDDDAPEPTTNIERGDALRWFMFPSEAAALLSIALPEHSHSGILPLSYVPPTGTITGALRPPNICGARESAPNAHGQSYRTESRKHPLRVTEELGSIRSGLIHQRAAPFCVGDAPSAPQPSVAEAEFRAESTLEPRVRELTLDVSPPMKEVTVTEDSMPEKRVPMTNDQTLDGAVREKEVKKKRHKFAKPSPKLLRMVNQAIQDFDMIQPGDRILLGLSGGKDSLAMLHILMCMMSRYPPGTFTLACATVDPGTEAFNPRPLIPYVESLGIEYHYLEEEIMAMADAHMTGDSICAFCARMKRGALYTCCRKYGYNKLVLAQHLDDCVESFLMSTMYNGTMRTMKASYLIDEGDITVIRPAIYLREKALRDFSYEAGLPVINENCPACFEAPKERQNIKKLLSREESSFPSLYSCMRNALMPLFDPAAMDILSMIRETIDGRNKFKERAKAQRAESLANGKCNPKRGEVSIAKNGANTEPGTELNINEPIELSSASEMQLLAELNKRRRERIRQTTKTNDSEFDADLTEKQVFCTAEGCKRE